MNNPNLSLYQDPKMVAETQRNFIRQVYGWMTLGLFITAVASLIMSAISNLMQAILHFWMVWVILLLVELGLVIFLTAAINEITPSVARLCFIVYAALNGVTLSVIFLEYTGSSVFQTFLICACMFAFMSVSGYKTKRDLTSLGSLLFMGLVGIIVAGLLDLIFKSMVIYWGVTIVGILIFVGLTAYDTQKLKKMSLSVNDTGELESKESILGALALYLDFINLFLLLLRIFGRRK